MSIDVLLKRLRKYVPKIEIKIYEDPNQINNFFNSLDSDKREKRRRWWEKKKGVKYPRLKDYLSSQFEKRNIKASELAKELHVSKTAISAYCKGDNFPRREYIIDNFCAYFEISKTYFNSLVKRSIKRRST